MESEENDLQLVQDILSSEKFEDAPEEEKQEIIELLHDKFNIFENMPYDVFVSIVRQGRLSGKDLIYICNASQKLRGYCDRPLRRKDGSFISKHLFRLLLEDVDVRLPEDVDPEQYYLYYFVGDGLAFRSLSKKLQYIVDITGEISRGAILRYPYDLYDLLYSDIPTDCSFLMYLEIKGEIQDRGGNFRLDHQQITEIAHDAHLLIDVLFDKFVTEEYRKVVPKTLENIMRYGYVSDIGVINEIEDILARQSVDQQAQILSVLAQYSSQKIFEILKNYEEYVRRSLSVYSYVEDSTLRELIRERFDEMRRYIVMRRPDLDVSELRGFTTAQLLQLIAHIINNKLYQQHAGEKGRPIRRNLRDDIIAQFPGLILPERVSVRAIKDLINADWIHGGRSENIFAPANEAGLQLENYRTALYDYINQNFDWLRNRELWPVSQSPGGIPRPSDAVGLDHVFTGSGYKINEPDPIVGRLFRKPSTFEERINGVITLFKITNRRIPPAPLKTPFKLTEEEIMFLIKLHKKVLAGELKVSVLFRLEDLA